MFSRAILRAGAAKQPMSLVVRSTGTCSTGVRDEKNFPRPVRGDPGKVRLGFVPEEWFQFMHGKTGVTGPYMLSTGLFTYLLSKEIWVLEHEYYNGLSMLIIIVYAYNKFGDKIAAWLDKGVDDYCDQLNEGRNQSLKTLQDVIEAEKKAQWSAKGQELLMQAKKENVALQLEAVYRERLMKAYTEVKKRLDYQVEKANLERRIAQKNMVDWIIRNVRSAITPESEKQTLDRCIADLGALAARAN